MSIMKRIVNRLLVSGALSAVLLMIFAASSPVAFASGGGTHVTLQLTHEPTGTATLKWNPNNKKLWVTVTMTGLAPNSTHPEHIHAGDCDDNGAIVYMLNNIVADGGGNGSVTTVISNVKGGIPASGWYVNVHNGPGLSTDAQFTPIACGNVSNSNTSLKHVQTVWTHLGATDAPNQSAWGNASLTLTNSNEQLTVVVTVHGLAPHSAHAAHIHTGSCQNQGPVLYMLNNVVADGNGNATVTTVVNDVEFIPTTGWYLNVHRSTNLSTQTGFDPIACGNIVN